MKVNRTFQLAYRLVGAALPIAVVLFTSIAYAQDHSGRELRDLMRDMRGMESRLSRSEIDHARLEERWVAIAARIESMDKTLWWLFVGTFGSVAVSGAVGTDRAVHRYRSRGGT
jgi:hypothetical protein